MRNFIAKLKDLYKILRILFNSDEWYLATGTRDHYDVIKYDYKTNTDRLLFFYFVKEDIKKKLKA